MVWASLALYLLALNVYIFAAGLFFGTTVIVRIFLL